MGLPKLSALGSCASLILATWGLSATVRGQSFTYSDASANAPPLLGATEATKFGDFDLDGDLDLVYANGGDAGNQQSRLLVNNGLAQGGTIGTFSDITATNLLPNVMQSSRDVQVVDIDHDGDLDFYFSNHSQNATQSATFFVNQGGAQGGTAGVFQLTMSHWFDIAANGSSIPVPQKITTGSFAGGFQDWSCQCEFADVDLDGDVDLYHSSYGSGFNALVMSRIFLNGSGAAPLGFFKEYNPSGAVSGNPNLATGSGAGFAEGRQINNTMNIAGDEHDITNMALDVDFADMDGDLDNDIHGNSRDTQNRMYQNRWFENGGSLGDEGLGTRLFRDVTGSWTLGPGGLAQAGANYDSEVNDLDNDNDVDAYFINYTGGTNDNYGFNDGTGRQLNWQTSPSSGNDDNEADMVDYDFDGDLEVLVSAFGGIDKLYKNQFVETGSTNLVLTAGVLAQDNFVSLAADVGDMDNDGDPDLVFAKDGNQNEQIFSHNANVPDPIAPRVPRLTQLANAGPSSQARAVVAQAFDNINFEYFHTATATLHYTVDGAPKSTPARFSGGNLFRATIPGYWTGSIAYSLTVTDRTGNTGTSPTKSVTIAPAGLSNYGSGTPGCSGAQAIGANSAPTVPNPDFALTCTNAPPSALGLGLIGDAQSLGSDPLGLGVTFLVDLFGSAFLTGVNFTSDPAGNAVAPTPIPDNPGLVGAVLYGQGIFAWAGPCSPSPFNLSSSNGLQFTLLP